VVRQKSFIALAVFLVLMLAGAIGVYAYDASRDDLIADGITVGGVHVGGMRAAEARTAIDEQLARPLQEPLVVRHGKRRFRLTADEARLRVASERMVQEALEESREGNVISRTVREITGEDPDEAALPARVSYSRGSVDKLVGKVEDEVNQPAQDAEVTFSGASLGTVDGQEGVAVKADKLRRAIKAELVLPHADRVVEVSTRVTQPEVTRDELASKYPAVITINRPSFELRFWKNLELVKTYTIAVGAIGYDTPSGLYHIQNKAVNPAWTMPDSDWVAPEDRGTVVPGGVPENPLKARWMGIYDGAGIHGTDATYSLGTAASHGCIRMAIPDVIELYDQVPISTPVYIA
jgi:lipoprotein-anchoring transpeptidase ErfK/SrfK